MSHRISPDALEAFEVYVDMGNERSLIRLLAKLIEMWGKERAPSERTITAWSRRYQWQARLDRLEERILERMERQIAKREADDRLKRQQLRLQDATAVRTVCRSVLVGKDGKAKKVVAGVAARVIHTDMEMNARMLEVAIKGLQAAGQEERLDMGEPTERTDVTTQGEKVETVIHEYVGVDPEAV